MHTTMAHVNTSESSLASTSHDPENSKPNPICGFCSGTGRESWISHDGGQESWPCAEGCNEPASPARTEAYEAYDYDEIPW